MAKVKNIVSNLRNIRVVHMNLELKCYFIQTWSKISFGAEDQLGRTQHPLCHSRNGPDLCLIGNIWLDDVELALISLAHDNNFLALPLLLVSEVKKTTNIFYFNEKK